MRLLLEVIIAALLIGLSWNKSFKQLTSEVPGIGSFFTESSMRKVAAPKISATPPKSFTGHIYYTDEQGKQYWLDAQGRRHYAP